jgi:hypothetical protein
MVNNFDVNGIKLDGHYASRHGAALLLILRAGLANDIASFCELLGIDKQGTLYGWLCESLMRLKKAGLVEFETQDQRYFSPITGRISLTDHWKEIQIALDLSLVDLAGYRRGRSVIVTPWFGQPEQNSVQADIFVLMPFNAELQALYEDHIRAIGATLDLTVARADDFSNTGPIMSDIWNSISAAKVLIADCTGRNPNVFYEIGIAHTLGKPVILIAQDGSDIPFDIRHLRYSIYSFTPRGAKELEIRLVDMIRSELEM